MCNGRLLQLFECIESTQNEVKRKMRAEDVGTRVPKSHVIVSRNENCDS